MRNGKKDAPLVAFYDMHAVTFVLAPPGWRSGERVGLMTLWL